MRSPLVDVAGVSLEASLIGAGPTPGRPAFAQRGRIAVGPDVRRLPQEDAGDVSGSQYAWIEERFKLLRHTSGAEELYDLRADPHEQHNLVATGATPDALRLRAALEEHLNAHAPRGEGIPAEIDPQTREELRALGYSVP